MHEVTLTGTYKSQVTVNDEDLEQKANELGEPWPPEDDDERRYLAKRTAQEKLYTRVNMNVGMLYLNPDQTADGTVKLVDNS